MGKINGFSTLFIIALSVLGFLVGFKACAENKAKKEIMVQVDDLKAQLAGKDETIKRYIDRDSNNHLRIKQLELDKHILGRISELDRKNLAIKEKQLKALVKFNTKIDTFFILDTFKTFEDKFIYIRLNKDTVILKAKDSFGIAQYWDRTWFLGRKNTFIDIWNHNPHVQMDRITAYKIKDRSPLFVVAPYVGYDVITKRTSAGVCIIVYRFGLKIY